MGGCGDVGKVGGREGMMGLDEVTVARFGRTERHGGRGEYVK